MRNLLGNVSIPLNSILLEPSPCRERHNSVQQVRIISHNELMGASGYLARAATAYQLYTNSRHLSLSACDDPDDSGIV